MVGKKFQIVVAAEQPQPMWSENAITVQILMGVL